MKHISIVLVCIIFISTSCKQSAANDKSLAVNSTDSTSLANRADGDAPIDTLRLPIPHNDEGISIFLPGPYRGTEPSEYKQMFSEEWYAIYLDSLSRDAYLQKAAFKIQKEPDDCLGLGDSSTYVMSDNENIELFVKGINPKNLHLRTLHHTQTSVWTNSQYSFDWGSEHYTLRAEGNSDKEHKQFDKDDWGRTTCWEENLTNYKLYLSVGQQQQLLIAIPQFNNTNVQIVFIGDLDEDGKPDFIFDTSTEYEAKTFVLFLSSKAKNSEIVRCVGEASYQFDC